MSAYQTFTHALYIWKKRSKLYRVVTAYEALSQMMALWAVLHIFFGFPMIALYADYFDHQPMRDNLEQTLGSLIHFAAFVQLIRWKKSSAWLYTIATAYGVGLTVPQGMESGYWMEIWNHNRVLSGIIETYYIFVPSLLVLGYVWFLRLKGNLGSDEATQL